MNAINTNDTNPIPPFMKREAATAGGLAARLKAGSGSVGIDKPKADDKKAAAKPTASYTAPEGSNSPATAKAKATRTAVSKALAEKTPAAKKPAKAKVAKAKPAKAAKAKPVKAAKKIAKPAKGKVATKKAAAPKAGGRREQVETMLRAKGGATAAAIAKKMSWELHTTRGFISRMGSIVTRDKVDGVTVYAIK